LRRFVKRLQRRFWRGYVRGASQLHELTYLFWETTLACNLSCRHCGSDCAPSAALADELTTAEVKAVFDGIARAYNPRRITVAVTGGEPLLRPDVFEVAAHIARLGFRWGMVTNGLLMGGRAVELSKAAGMGSISVSLDGLQAQHEYLRGKGTFAPTVDAVRRLKQANFLQILEVVTCPTAAVVERLDETYEFMRSLGVDGWRLLPLAPIGRVRRSPELMLSGAQLRQLLDWLKAKRAAKTAPLKVTLDEEGFLGDEYEREVRDMPYFCFAGVHAASILANGDVSACPSVDRRFVQGNVRQRSFTDIWEREFRLYRDRSWMQRGQCAGCNSFADCLGNSFHLWESPDATGPACCHLRLLQQEQDGGL
jgi:radical SAM protein with 4Fe4S-binding SPASM domain